MVINQLCEILENQELELKDKISQIKSTLKSNIKNIDINSSDKLGRNFFHFAVITNDTNLLNSLYQKNKNKLADTTDFREHALIHYACIYDATASLNWLILKGAQSNHKNTKGETIAHYAVRHGSAQLLKVLFNNNIELDLPDENGIYPIHLAIMQGYADKLIFLLDKKINTEQCTEDGNANHFVHLAAHHGQLKILELLHQAGYELNSSNEQGLYPFHLAAYHGHSKIVTYLLNNGSSVNQKTEHKNFTTVMHLATEQGQLTVLKALKSSQPDYLMPDHKGLLPVHIAVIRGKVECLEWLINANRSAVFIPTALGYYLMHLAAIHGQVKCLKSLLQLSILNNWSIAGGNPFTLAIEYCQLGAVKFFSENIDTICASLSENSSFTFSPTLANLYHSPMKIFAFMWSPLKRLLHKSDARLSSTGPVSFINQRTQNGNYPIHYIVNWFSNSEIHTADLDILKVLIVAKADVNALTLQNNTLLHLLISQLPNILPIYHEEEKKKNKKQALFKQYIDIINELLINEINPYIRNKNNQMAIDSILSELTNRNTTPSSYFNDATRKILKIFIRHGITFEENVIKIDFQNISHDNNVKISLYYALGALDLFLDFFPKIFHSFITYRDNNNDNLIIILKPKKDYSLSMDKQEYKEIVKPMLEYGFLIGAKYHNLFDCISSSDNSLDKDLLLAINIKKYDHKKALWININEATKDLGSNRFIHHARIISKNTLKDVLADRYLKIVGILLALGYPGSTNQEMVELKLAFFELLKQASLEVRIEQISYLLSNLNYSDLPMYFKREDYTALKKLHSTFNKEYNKGKIPSLLELTAEFLITSNNIFEINPSSVDEVKSSIANASRQNLFICQNKQKILNKLVVIEKGFFSNKKQPLTNYENKNQEHQYLLKK